MGNFIHFKLKKIILSGQKKKNYSGFLLFKLFGFLFWSLIKFFFASNTYNFSFEIYKNRGNFYFL